MELPRRTLLEFAGVAVAAPAFSKLVTAQTYPTRPITMIVPFAAGGAADTIARILAKRMRRSLGPAVIIENVSGADGNLAVGRAARAKPDGYTIIIGSIATHVMNGAFYSLPYDVLNDFAPISPLVTTPMVLAARKAMPAEDLNEFIAWLKANADRASAGVGSAFAHLATALFQKETATRFALVPYRGFAPAEQDVLAGHVDFTFSGTDTLSLMRDGGLKVYAVTSETRLSAAPAIPTFGEKGLPALSISAWFGLFAPKGTPRDIIVKLNAAVVEALTDPVVRSRISDLGQEMFPNAQQTPDALGALQKADAKKWWPLIKEFGIKAE